VLTGGECVQFSRAQFVVVLLKEFKILSFLKRFEELNVIYSATMTIKQRSFRLAALTHV
jgi:hypothetical protein